VKNEKFKTLASKLLKRRKKAKIQSIKNASPANVSFNENNESSN